MSTYNRTPVLDLVDEFEEFIGFSAANSIAHMVIEDYNLEDDLIELQLEWIEKNRAELLSQDDGVTESEIAMCIGFLNFLKTIPENLRELDMNDD